MPTLVKNPRIPAAVTEVLDAFRRAHGRDAWLWVRADPGSAWRVGAGTAPPEREGPGPLAAELPVGAWGSACVEVASAPEGGAEAALHFLAVVVARLLQHEAETLAFGAEMSERYEEINLLYSISEILGSVISLREAAATILSEVADVLGIERAALWVFDAATSTLEQIAAVGEEGQASPISIDDPHSVTAMVFRDRRSIILDPSEEFPREEPSPGVERGSFLSVPVSYTPPEGEPRTIGVINLIGRTSGEGFSAGDLKLTAAIASQIGAAVENSRLVAESVRQERLERELELAHDLQLKLLPAVEHFAGFGEVAARCVPAQSVGGDFYHLFRLAGGKLGVMIGDVSSHGFGAALIMALTMSAVAIHASEGDSPAEVLARAHRALIDELETTEMYLTLFYGVIDPRRGEITFANAGHSHAFRITPSGEAERLAATDPPFGIVDLDRYREEVRCWKAGEDLLFLFTDGLSDSLGLGEVAGEDALLDAVRDARAGDVSGILDRIFDLPRAAAEIPADDCTAVLVRA
jgi:sigma-B regulation protein RsbU (phosphoserine phosphatase)